ncbi:MAG: hypothetical protein QXO70_01730 [Candidatus Pacearchaeota archaeon]
MKDNFLVCPYCKKNTYVQVERNSPYETGWGCLSCKTAVKKKTKCYICNSSIDIYTKAGVELKKKFICKRCLENLNQKYPVIFAKHIPSWRLHLDDATPKEMLERSYKDFGMPTMSEEKWRKYYSQPHEVKKEREFMEFKNQMRREAIRELLASKNIEKK